MASTIRFGSTSDPCRLVPLDRAQQAEADGNCDPEKLLQCPFDKNHQIRACRFPYHLIKCRKNHPKLAKELKTCPFNARHLVPQHELTYHSQTCEDRISVDTEDAESTNRHWHVPVSTWVNPNMSEDWDKEVDDDAASPFVWGVTTVQNNGLDARPTNNLRSSFRAPATLPWSSYEQ
ncbi:gametocyte-specific factor 1 [Kryptolebias marmoratus]|uniref:Gametocyte-specific factor 1-like n=1 Tax=Kryptolebias marmoratus TaxID=37003 RepID=A0A3Q2ZVU7_KRYMA|nr:gametocyte-specific factor 1 [Kryptolebias marmoratus]XP_017274645.1 gametocyte-specific factor 1 [Kryptolebias marmoratus]